MDKRRIKTPKTIQMKYPALYSHSWSSPESAKKADKPKKKTKKNPSVQQNFFPGCCRRPKPKPLHGSDPYASHLKYGIFPQQVQKTKGPLINVNANPSAPNTTDSSTASEPINNKEENKKAKRGQMSETPLFVIRPIDKKYRRQLSMSETIHWDIKPQRNIPRPPLVKQFKNAIPKMNSNVDKC